MNYKTKKAMQAHALTLPDGGPRAQCYTISSYPINCGQTIAEQLYGDHQSDGAMRAAKIMVDAGCAIYSETEYENKKHLFGTFTFNDGSELS